ncbi:MAG: gamma-glutamylcyclotransferase family protein [Paracoccus sp. (in: a-proteobacteria)]
MSFLYFAYGSNMLPARLTARCPSARVTGAAVAPGWRVAFGKHGRDGSGKATLIADAGGRAPGMLFRIGKDDLPALDRAEGVGKGYDRRDDLRIEAEGGGLAAVSYVAPHPRPGLMPFDWYLALVVAGAELGGLAPAHVAALRRQGWRADPEPDRLGRSAALRALAAHGRADVAAVLAGR